MAPSPGSLNTPGPAVPTPSPCNLQEDQAYREKVRQLSKYIEPLRRMINRIGNDGMYTFFFMFINIRLYTWPAVMPVVLHKQAGVVFALTFDP
jgi:hypothetical protein